MFEFTTAAVIYCALVGAGFLTLWLWYDRRDHRTFEAGRRRAAFHCIRCDALFAGAPGAQIEKCPKCGHENARLRF
ncbi:MAG: hydrogenase nickel incorporation protein HypA [Verrucomicrobia bacterium]|nr:hydrogenase nickel incorporation protein HypA [Verrucomicrobiota bacterium]